MNIVTSQGDVLDELVWRHYGHQPGAVERVLEANPGLADMGPVLPAGKVLVLPAPPEPVRPRTVSLWD
ncbi:tail protein X [Grimontia kaedaensis]|uniref:Tail protein X n=1 Tax=Grimontia kaedaensis TaxID=2872157 RepID=A0ABY4WNA5_9GAMM|nr:MULTISPECIES: tail protein X [Grimontia]USH01051.1 tail protein X [Grimontia kaedaensis]